MSNSTPPATYFKEPIRGELRHSMVEATGELHEHANGAMEETMQTALQAKQRTQADARHRASRVGDHVQQAAQSVRGNDHPSSTRNLS